MTIRGEGVRIGMEEVGREEQTCGICDGLLRWLHGRLLSSNSNNGEKE